MITLGYFRRHQQALRGGEDVVLLDVAQEYVLEHLRRHARDLYDLEHPGRVMQIEGVGRDVAELAALKIYFDVVEERLSRAPESTEAIFSLPATVVIGAAGWNES